MQLISLHTLMRSVYSLQSPFPSPCPSLSRNLNISPFQFTKMRMFSWIHSKRNNGCKHVCKKRDLVSSANHYIQKEATACKEEFIDWPHGHGLLAIGTIGNANLKEITEKTNLEQHPSPPHETSSQDLTPEEEGELQDQLDLLFNEAALGQVTSVADQPAEAPSLSLDKSAKQSSDIDDVQRSTSAVYNNIRGKDICFDSRGTAIRKKTLSFLLKKMFACRSTGFAPTPSLRDPISESRMEKMLRAILHKKICPQSSATNTTLSAKKRYLENRQKPKSGNDDDENDKRENGSKWVKTDSEYIVLEIQYLPCLNLTQP